MRQDLPESDSSLCPQTAIQDLAALCYNRLPHLCNDSEKLRFEPVRKSFVKHGHQECRRFDSEHPEMCTQHFEERVREVQDHLLLHEAAIMPDKQYHKYRISTEQSQWPMDITPELLSCLQQLTNRQYDDKAITCVLKSLEDKLEGLTEDFK